MTNQLITNLTDMGTYVRNTRKKNKISIEGMAEKTGIARNTILHFEQGRRTPHFSKMMAILDKAGIELVLRLKEPEI